ncbi:hypothetical protein EDC04DRAFT_2909422 [Pisolithus marmoratus]|nr:hypothetical protein EDC04DRAFT_2909422 [Pisolithus marmoratus]
MPSRWHGISRIAFLPPFWAFLSSRALLTSLGSNLILPLRHLGLWTSLECFWWLAGGLDDTASSIALTHAKSTLPLLIVPSLPMFCLPSPPAISLSTSLVADSLSALAGPPKVTI